MKIKKVTKQYIKNLDNSVVFCSYLLELDSGKTWTVPLNEENTHYQAIQQWIADGGTVIDNGE